MSSTKGHAAPAGTATVQGFVPSNGVVPPQGATAAPAFVIAMPMKSLSKAIIAQRAPAA